MYLWGKFRNMLNKYINRFSHFFKSKVSLQETKHQKHVSIFGLVLMSPECPVVKTNFCSMLLKRHETNKQKKLSLIFIIYLAII